MRIIKNFARKNGNMSMVFSKVKEDVENKNNVIVRKIK